MLGEYFFFPHEQLVYLHPHMLTSLFVLFVRQLTAVSFCKQFHHLFLKFFYVLKLIKSYEEFYSLSAGEISAKTIAEYARKNNAFCKAVYKKSGEMLGKAVSILVDLLNVDKVVAGGIYMRATDLLYPHAIKVIERESLPLNLKNFELLPAFLGENIGDYAALAVAEGIF